MSPAIRELIFLRQIHQAACDVRLAEEDPEFARMSGGLIQLRRDLRSKMDNYHAWLDEADDCRNNPV